jgi:hypothetical protein
MTTKLVLIERHKVATHGRPSLGNRHNLMRKQGVTGGFLNVRKFQRCSRCDLNHDELVASWEFGSIAKPTTLLLAIFGLSFALANCSRKINQIVRRSNGLTYFAVVVETSWYGIRQPVQGYTLEYFLQRRIFVRPFQIFLSNPVSWLARYQ